MSLDKSIAIRELLADSGCAPAPGVEVCDVRDGVQVRLVDRSKRDPSDIVFLIQDETNELWQVLRDAVAEGDLVGHLRAYLEVATGEVTPDTRFGMAEYGMVVPCSNAIGAV